MHNEKKNMMQTQALGVLYIIHLEESFGKYYGIYDKRLFIFREKEGVGKREGKSYKRASFWSE